MYVWEGSLRGPEGAEGEETGMVISRGFGVGRRRVVVLLANDSISNGEGDVSRYMYLCI